MQLIRNLFARIHDQNLIANYSESLDKSNTTSTGGQDTDAEGSGRGASQTSQVARSSLFRKVHASHAHHCPLITAIFVPAEPNVPELLTAAEPNVPELLTGAEPNVPEPNVAELLTAAARDWLVPSLPTVLLASHASPPPPTQALPTADNRN
jgi:hypothetical protein